MQKASRILIISPSWLGDIIMSQSLLKVLKKKYPDSLIDVFAPGWTIPILKRMPEVANTIENPFAHGVFEFFKRKSVGRSLCGTYDMAFVLPNSFKSALVPFFAGIKVRRGLKGESRFFVLNDIRFNKKDFPRMVERYVSLAYSNKEVKRASDLEPFDYPKLNVFEVSDSLLSKLHLTRQRPFIALGTGANYGPSKIWPYEYYADVCRHFINKGYSILALGSKKDKDGVRKVKDNLSDDLLKYFFDIAGETNLTEALDILSLCKGAVCNDSGLMHTLAAANIPQVCIFGSTSTKYTPPLSDKAICIESDEPCHPCFKRECKFNTYACQRKILSSTVIEKLEYLLNADS